MLRGNSIVPTMNLYCSLHQCYKSAAPSRNPSEQGALRWLAACRSYRSRQEHEAAFAATVLLPR